MQWDMNEEDVWESREEQGENTIWGGISWIFRLDCIEGSDCASGNECQSSTSQS